MRDYNIYLKDIADAITRIEEYTKGLALTDFKANKLKQDGVIRNLIVIGEAAKMIPDNVKTESKDIDWNKIVGLRDIVVHQYFSIDVDLIWNIVTDNIPVLKNAISKFLK